MRRRHARTHEHVRLSRSEHRSLNRIAESSWSVQSLTPFSHEISCFAAAPDNALATALRAARPGGRDRGPRARNARQRVASHPAIAISAAPNCASTCSRVRKTDNPGVTPALSNDSTSTVTAWPLLRETHDGALQRAISSALHPARIAARPRLLTPINQEMPCA